MRVGVSNSPIEVAQQYKVYRALVDKNYCIIMCIIKAAYSDESIKFPKHKDLPRFDAIYPS